jgi:uncharacterized protein YbaR (Trm112 family)
VAVCGRAERVDPTWATAGPPLSGLPAFGLQPKAALESGMAIHPDLLEILACPVCKTPVELVKDGAGLRCAQCHRVYPIRDDIPIMLPEEASVEE